MAQDEGEENRIRISGIIIDDSTGLPVPFAHIIDVIRFRGASADHEGKFSLWSTPFDTLKISAIGYEDCYYIPFNLDKKELMEIEIRLKPRIYQLDGLDIFAEDPIKKFFRDQGQTRSYPLTISKGYREYTPDAGTAGTGYVEAFANLFNRHYKQGKKMEEIKEEEKRLQEAFEKDQRIKKRFGKEKLAKMTGMSGKDVEQFMTEYPLSDQFILEASEYEYLAVIMRNLRDYKFRHKLDMDVAEILERAVFRND